MQQEISRQISLCRTIPKRKEKHQTPTKRDAMGRISGHSDGLRRELGLPGSAHCLLLGQLSIMPIKRVQTVGRIMEKLTREIQKQTTLMRQEVVGTEAAIVRLSNNTDTLRVWPDEKPYGQISILLATTGRALAGDIDIVWQLRRSVFNFQTGSPFHTPEPLSVRASRYLRLALKMPLRVALPYALASSLMTESLFRDTKIAAVAVNVSPSIQRRVWRHHSPKSLHVCLRQRGQDQREYDGWRA